MPLLLDCAYLLALVLLSPWLLYKAITTGKYRRGLRAKLLGPRFPADTPKGVVWFHGVSVGEIHLLRPVIAGFRRRYPGQVCVISTTTDTGMDEANKSFADLPIFWFPFDFSWSVRRTLRQLQPTLLVLAEGELWPNLLLAARRYAVPLAIINARMSPRSLRHYQFFSVLARPLLRSLQLIAAQTEDYASAFRALGADRGAVQVTGSVKFDGISSDRRNAKTDSLRQLLGNAPDQLVWVAGSTQAPEEAIALSIYSRLRAEFSQLRLFLVPRQKDRFDEVARLLERSGQPFIRRSTLHPNAPLVPRPGDIILVDTIGELGAIWGLADVAFVGGSLDGKRGGQNMIEPAGYGASVLFGPHVWNFRDAAQRLIQAGGARQVADEAELEQAVRDFLNSVESRSQFGDRARAFVLSQQGATERTITLLGELLAARMDSRRAA
jgi:3-deoxy-D-manno-octulosonic-acid transferase